VVEALMTMRDHRGCVSFASELAVGQQIRMLVGPFAEMVGQLEWLDDAGRVQVLLNLLGGAVRVRAQAETLVPA
jgi:transcriptional antiterminator RfaH